jgi:small subunit ribosomal protein S17
MADTENNETPDEAVEPTEAPVAEEAVETVEASEAETTGEAEAADAAPADVPAESAPEAETLTKSEQRAAARHAEASKRPTRTPEERQAERVEARKAKAVARRRRRLQEREKAAANRTEVAPTPPVERPKGAPKVRQGVVVSAKPDKSITVRIDVARRHRRYEKIVRSSAKLHAHDENNEANEGDTVRIVEARPLSKSKRWRLTDVLERAK